MADDATVDGSAPTRRRPVTLRVLCLLVLAEAVVVLCFVGALAVEVASGASPSPGASLFLIIFGLLIVSVLVGGSRGLWNGRRWARSPVMTWQIFQGACGVLLAQSGSPAGGVAILAAAMLGGVLLVLPPVVAATTR